MYDYRRGGKMKYRIVKEFPNDILYEREGPCISIYQPTHRQSAERGQDRIVFKNQIQKIERTLESQYTKNEIAEMLIPLYELEKDSIFWSHTKDGIVVFMNENDCIIYNLDRKLEELTVVSDSFHIKPLIRVFQSADKYYVLGINQKTFKLFHGNRYDLTEITFDDDMDVNIEDVLGDQFTDSYLTNASYGGVGKNTMYHGHGSKKDEIGKDIEKYFRYIDRFVMNDYSKPAQAPLVLAALDEYQGTFRKLTHNNWLLDKGIVKDMESLSIDELRDESWKIVEGIYLERTRVLVDRYETAKAKGLAEDDLASIAKKAVQTRVASMLIESDKILPGRINLQTGELTDCPIEDIKTDDLLDDLTELVFSAGGEVVVLPKDRMPTDTGVAAVYRY